MTTTPDRTVASFLLPNGAISERAIGCKFRGKKPGAWRKVKKVSKDGREVWYTDHNWRGGMCFLTTFLAWIDHKEQASLPGEDFQDDDLLHRTVRMLRKRGYRVEDVITALQEIVAEMEPSE